MTLNEVRSKANYKVVDLGNGKIRVTGKQSGHNTEVNETQCWVLSNYKKVKKGKINLPFESSKKKDDYHNHRNLKKVQSYNQNMNKYYGQNIKD